MKKINSIPFKFIIGLVLSLLAAILMFYGIYPLAGRITIGIIGLILIATSNYRLLK